MLYKRAVPLRRGAAPRNGRRRRGVAGERKSTMSPVSDRPVSDRVIAATASMAAVQDFYFNSRYADRPGQPGVCHFTFGNPQEFPLPGLLPAPPPQADRHAAIWYDYKQTQHDTRPS